MQVVYDSKTGNVSRFVRKLDANSVRIEENLQMKEPFILVTYTTGFGQVPEKVLSFLEKNHEMLKGVAASGNRNWGPSFAKSADVVSALYRVPVIHKFELDGTREDVAIFRERMKRLETY